MSNRERFHLPKPRPALRAGALIGGVAAALAATAAVNVYRARQAERRNPPKGRFVEVDGVRLHYLEKGEGPPVVLLHGNVVTADDFLHSGLFDRVAARHRVVAFDRPGLGYSDRPRGPSWSPADQAALLRRAFAALGIERPVVVGHSWGAMVAVALALDHPDAVGGLVLLDGYYYATARMDVALVLPQAVPVLGDALCYTLAPPLWSALMPGVVKAMFAPLPVPDHFSDSFRTGIAVRPWQIRAMAHDGAKMSTAAAAVQERYGELSLPVVIMAGAEDKVADVDRQAKRLHQDVPRSALRLVPGAGHMVHYAVPEEVAAAIDAVSADALTSSDPAGTVIPASSALGQGRPVRLPV